MINYLQLQANLEHLDSFRKRQIDRIIREFNAALAKDKFDVGQVCICLV